MTDNDKRVTERQSSGVTIVGKTKMGSGTRDQTTLKLKGKGTDAAEAEAEFETALEAAEAGNWGHRLLQLNPERQENKNEE